MDAVYYSTLRRIVKKTVSFYVKARPVVVTQRLLYIAHMRGAKFDKSGKTC